MILSLVAVMTMSASAFAAENNSVNNDRNDKQHKEALSNYLQMDNFQEARVLDLSEKFQNQVQEAEQLPEAEKTQAIKKAVTHNLRNVNAVLTRDQYKKYQYILNTTLRNKGLEDYIR